MISLPEFSMNLAHWITKDLDYPEDKKEILAYAIETALLTILGTFLLILLGFLINALIPALFTAVFGVLLRRVSGGAHFNTPVKCLVIGAFSYSFLGVLAKRLVEYHYVNDSVLIIMELLSLIIVAFWAPVDTENKPIRSSQLKIKLKLAAIVFVLVSSLMSLTSGNDLLNVSIGLGIFYQSLTLLPIFNRRGGTQHAT